MRRLAFLWTLLALSPGLPAEPAKAPFLIFREADSATEKRVQRELITEKTLGGLAPETRRQAREELSWIGSWCVPYLEIAIRKQSSARIRMNAVLALAMIRDPRGLPVLREAAKEDKVLYVRRAATLAIGLFEWGKEDVETLGHLPNGEWRAIAPALARLRNPAAAAILKANAVKFPPTKYDYDRAAILISAAIAGPGAPLVEHLEDGEDLVQEAAAMGLAVRPLPAHRAGEIIAALDRSKLSSTARVLAIHALGSIRDRPPEAQERLLDIAWKDGKEAERIAALLELRGTPDEFPKLWKAYLRDGGKNDPVAATLLVALARTGEDKAKERLRAVLQREKFLGFYAAGALLYANGTDQLPDEIRREIVDLGDKELVEIAGMAASTSEEKRAAALLKLKRLPDRRGLELFYSPEERIWREVNRLLTRIFDIDPVLLQFNSSNLNDPDSPLGGGGGVGDEPRKAKSGSPEDQDLSDLLVPPRVEHDPPYPERRPYFGPEDLGVG